MLKVVQFQPQKTKHLSAVFGQDSINSPACDRRTRSAILATPSDQSFTNLINSINFLFSPLRISDSAHTLPARKSSSSSMNVKHISLVHEIKTNDAITTGWGAQWEKSKEMLGLRPSGEELGSEAADRWPKEFMLESTKQLNKSSMIINEYFVVHTGFYPGKHGNDFMKNWFVRIKFSPQALRY